MKNLIILILIALLGFFGWQYYQDNYVEVETPVTQTDVSSDEETEELDEATESEGSISGDLCFPSEYIPALTIYVEETETGQLYTQNTEINTFEYQFTELPVGTYVAYAYPQEEDGFGGGYTPAVECGLTVECEDHSLVEIEVSANSSVENIDICDWYGAEIPPKP